MHITGHYSIQVDYTQCFIIIIKQDIIEFGIIMSNSQRYLPLPSQFFYGFHFFFPGKYEIRLVPAGPGRVLNPLVRTFYRRFGNWNADEDVFEELRRSFDRTEIVRTFALGTNYVAVAEKAEP